MVTLINNTKATNALVVGPFFLILFPMAIDDRKFRSFLQQGEKKKIGFKKLWSCIVDEFNYKQTTTE